MITKDIIRKKIKLGERFILISEQEINKTVYSILLDSITSICYLQCLTDVNSMYGSSVSITPLLNSDGSNYKLKNSIQPFIDLYHEKQDLLQYLDKDVDFKLALIKESMSGEITLKNSKGASADSIISPKGFFIIDDSYVKSIFSKIKFDIRGKSRSGITGIAFRIDLK